LSTVAAPLARRSTVEGQGDTLLATRNDPSSGRLEGLRLPFGNNRFLNGKISNEDLEIMVAGDSRMRRPYVVAAAPGDEPRQQAARRMAKFLREPETQAWIKEFGRGELDDGPLFFPVALPSTKESAKAP
jgi:hypothetical protein